MKLPGTSCSLLKYRKMLRNSLTNLCRYRFESCRDPADTVLRFCCPLSTLMLASGWLKLHLRHQHETVTAILS